MNINVCDGCHKEIDLKASIRLRANYTSEGKPAQQTFAFCSTECAAAALEKFGRTLKPAREGRDS